MTRIQCAICGDVVERKGDLYIGKSLFSKRSATFHKSCWLNKSQSDSGKFQYYRAPYNGDEGKQTHWDDLAYARTLLIVGAVLLLLFRFVVSGDYRLVLLDFVMYSIVCVIAYVPIVMVSNLQIARLRRRWAEEYEKHLPD